MLSLQLLGGCSLRCHGETVAGPAVQPRRLALFALAAGFPARRLSRDKAAAFFWAEEDREHARHFLADSLFTIRKCAGKDIFVLSANEIRLNPAALTVDLWEFEKLFAEGDFAAAVRLYHGPFLDGFFVSDAPEFERWVDGERDRLAKMYASSLEKLASGCEESAMYDEAAEWWLKLAAHDPFSSRIALRTMVALDMAGDSAAAIQHALKHERAIRRDLGISPDDAVIALTEKLREKHSHAVAVSEPNRETGIQAIGPQAQPIEPVVLPVPASRPLAMPRPLSSAFRTLAIGASLLAAADARVPAPSAHVSQFVSAQPPSSSDTARVRTARERADELYHRARLTVGLDPFPGRTEEALALYRLALKEDPTFARAYAGIADTYSRSGKFDDAREAALKALAMDSSLAEAHMALAYILAYFDHRWSAADSELAVATRLSPENAQLFMRRAYIAAAAGRKADALRYLERARTLEPESWKTLYNSAMIETQVGRLDEAIEHFKQTMELEPSRKEVKASLARTLWNAARPAEAASLFLAAGNVVEAAVARSDRTEMKELLARYRKGDLAIDPCKAAMLYAGLGDNDGAFKELRKSHYVSLARLLREPPLVSLRSDPRYGELLTSLGLVR